MTSARGTTTARIDELVGRARQETGLDDFGSDTWRQGLEVLVGSVLGESRLTEAGHQMFAGALTRILANRLRIEDWFVRHPEIDEEEVHVELLGVGFPRTGSTALAAMLGEDHSVRHLRMWEATAPCPPPGVSAEDDAARLAAAEAQVAAQDVALPQFRALLPSSATGPFEDHDLMTLEFTAQVFLSMARMPTYAEWFLDCDMEPTYRYERRVLKLLQWQCGPRRWQLKSPTHTLFLEAYEKVFPETRFVMTHRDVGKVLPSVADLYTILMSGSNTEVDRREVGELNMRQWGLALDRSLAFRSAGREEKFLDIAFRDFQADPIAEIRRLYQWLGRDLTPEIEGRMQAWRESNPRDKHGVHAYDGADFGITEDALARRFEAYRERFGALL